MNANSSRSSDSPRRRERAGERTSSADETERSARLTAVWRQGDWGLAVVAALVAWPTLASPGDASGPASGLLLALAAMLGLVAWSLWGMSHPTPPGWRVSWIEVVLGLGVAWIGGSGWWMAEQGNPRATLNSVWAWLGFAASYWLARQFVRDEVDRRAIVAVGLGLVVTQAAYGLYQSGYARPRDRAIYEQDPDRVLREIGIDAPQGSPVRALYDSRMRDTEPLGTYSLTNSLAGLLAPWIILAGSIGLSEYQQRQGKSPSPLGSQRVNERAGERESNSLGRGALFLLGLAGLAALFCLVLTKSRSAYIATMLGVAGLGWMAARRRWRIPARAWLAGAVGATLLVAIAAAIGFLDREVLSEARKSLGVRWEYWRATARLIRDYPFFGCGWGNYQAYYASYKAPESSETVADPHNAWFELAANAGLPAAALLTLGAAGVVWRLLRGSSADSPTAERATADAATSASRRIWIYVGAVAGAAASSLASSLGPAPAESLFYFCALPIGILVVAALDGWVCRGDLPAWGLGLALLVLAVNLSAAGSLIFPGVMVTGWLLASIRGDSSRPNALASSNSGQAAPQSEPEFKPRTSLALLMTTGSMILFIACIWTGFRPVVLSQLHLAFGIAEAQHGSWPAAAEQWKRSAEYDPWSSEPWVHLAGTARQFTSPLEASSWEAFDRSCDEAIARNRHSATLRNELGKLCLEVWRSTGDRRAIEAAERHFRVAATELYPHGIMARAQWAWTLHLKGDESGARREATEALRLHELMPHREQRLTMQQLFDAPRRWPDQPSAEGDLSAETWMRRLASAPAEK